MPGGDWTAGAEEDACNRHTSHFPTPVHAFRSHTFSYVQVATYREAIRVMEAHGVRTDPLQRLHTLHNLAEVLGIATRGGGGGARAGTGTGSAGPVTEGAGSAGPVAGAGTGSADSAAGAEPAGPAAGAGTGSAGPGANAAPAVAAAASWPPPGVSRTLRDDSLATEAEQIRTKYMRDRSTHMAVAEANVERSRAAAGLAAGAEWLVDGRGRRNATPPPLLLLPPPAHVATTLSALSSSAATAPASSSAAATAAAGGAACSPWQWLPMAVAGLVEVGHGPELVDSIKARLTEADIYRNQVRAGLVWGKV